MAKASYFIVGAVLLCSTILLCSAPPYRGDPHPHTSPPSTYKTYIVLLIPPPQADTMDNEARRSWHQSFLPSNLTDSGEPRVLHSYKTIFHGFAAWLTEVELDHSMPCPRSRALATGSRMLLPGPSNRTAGYDLRRKTMGGALAMPSLLPLFLILSTLSMVSAASGKHDQVYIVYLGEHAGAKAEEAILEDHHALLLSVKGSEEKARASLLYSYKHTLNGFAAILSQQEATELSERSDVVSAFRSEGRWAPHTTRSWEFVGLEEGLKGPDGSDWLPSLDKSSGDVIVGVLDSGETCFLEHIVCMAREREQALNPVCFCLHWKIIGARYYLKAYEAYYKGLNTTYAFRSPRDHDGHGTHTASTAAGRTVRGVSALGGFAAGSASGGAPLARLAVYKVCWPIPGPNPNIENTCFEADMLAAMDDAVGDGVDVMSVSIGSNGTPLRFADDGIAVGALHAARRGVVVSCSGGNSGPKPATVSNLAPWMLTVGASSIDRAFDSPIKLGNGVAIMGQTVTTYQLGKKPYPLVYSADAVVPGTPANVSNQCLPNSLSADKVRGKIVVCLRGSGLRVEKGLEVKRAGGAAILLGNPPAFGTEVPVDAHVLPGTAVSAADAKTILSYINSSSSPTAVLGPSTTVVDVRPSPVMAQFSSRGPNVLEPNILKPDVTAPGMNILAAWSEASSPTKLDGDHRVVPYNIMSGTSMSCPHVSAAAALLKAAHPDWSSAAIRSAIMTTATTYNAEGGPLMNGDGTVAGPMDYGSGHIRPKHALDPGLVYDASYEDYLLFACASAGSQQLDHAVPCPARPPPPYQLNHPSVAVHGLNGSVTVRRTVTNVGAGEARYTVAVVEPAGVSVKVSPRRLRFARAGEKRTFRIKMEATGGSGSGRAARGQFLAGSYAWSDGVHVVRSPIVVLVA
ncbi:Subtilisin-like protease SBT5.6 [Dichanthelium oligosanthes]|uniref:Subtilisin-like protease SBT5.6 n=1 Tax=Dichanthelium oligosanthes TaxID=888268 RepID=A0A1E5VTC7_9POAL|nr:Subtilisin-like protease SBT5.6 [Dichanthelium oligosanthes]